MSIRDVLKQRKLDQLKRSEVASENYSKRVSQRGAQVLSKLHGNTKAEHVLSPLASSLKSAYYSTLKDYRGEFGSVDPGLTKKAVALWERVAAACDQSGRKPEDFVRAQFEWFDKTFKTAPTPVQLTTEAAVDRARTTTGRRVIAPRKYTSSTAEVFKRSDELVRTMSQAQGCDRVEFYRRFVLTNLYAFPKEFLAADPAYAKAVKEGPCGG